MLLSCSIWLLYGAASGELALARTTALGVALAALYLTALGVYGSEYQSRSAQFGGLGVTCCVLVIYQFIGHSKDLLGVTACVATG